MDRTEASDAFNAGSIPVGCILHHSDFFKRYGDRMKETIKKRALLVRDFILARGKIVFPILLIEAVAITVAIVLQVKGKEKEEQNVANGTAAVSDGDAAPMEIPDVALELNAYPEVNNLLRTYYDAKASGDVDTIESIQNNLDDMERIKIPELANYIDSYPLIDVYTKPGPEEGSYLVIAYTHVVISYYPDDYLPGYETFYICKNEDGSLYINKGVVDESVSEYIRQVCLQDDVVELYNKITVEYNEVCLEKPEFLQYLQLIEQQVQQAAAVILANEVVGDVSGGDVSSGDVSGNTDVSANEGTDITVTEPEAPAGPIYATANTTVNVRSSDSETADKLGKLAGGTKVEVQEQKVNGWTRIVYEGKDGYVKSEFLNVAESAGNVDTIGTVTATANVNVRAAASETATKLGIVTGGESLELVAREGDWCKVIYNGQIGYVKAEFVQ